MENYTLANPSSAPPAVPPSAGGSAPQTGKKLPKFLLIGGIVIGLIIVFLLGVMIGGAGKKSASGTTAITPTKAPKVTPKGGKTSPTPQATGLYLPNKEYYDDTLVIVSKTEPRFALQLSISRFEQEKGFTQYAKVNYFNGTQWVRENVTTEIQRSGIINNPLIRLWNIKTKPSSSSRDLGMLEVTIENKPISFTVTKQSYDISTQSYPGYTKFNYFGEGILKIPNDQVEAYMFYSQTFSTNSFDLSYLSNPERLESDWFVFWDEQGNAYYADILSSNDKTKPLENYQTGAIYYAAGSSIKSGQPRLNRAQTNQYSAELLNTPPTRISFIVNNPLNKSTDKSYTWQTGIITGTTQIDKTTSNGVGLYEGIHKVAR